MQAPGRSRRHVLAGGAGTAAALLLGQGGPAYGQDEPNAMMSATAITQVFGDGQKLVCVAVEFVRPITDAGLSPATLEVPGRTVTSAHAATMADPAARAATGRFAVIALSPDDPGAALRQGGPGGPPPGGPHPGGPPGGPMGGPPPNMPAPTYRTASATVRQALPIAAADGQVFPPGGAITTTQIRNLVVDDFRQLTFHDAATGDVLRYNLFVPPGYDPGQSYPLVLFMHDAGATGTDPLITLRQGLGAVVWASPADQARRPCFVLAPQYAAQTVNDRSEATSLLDTTIDLVEALARQYSIDRDRLYATGQSGGAMMAIAMNLKHPGLFAASFIVAGQWDPAKTAPLARQRLWIMVSQGDLKAYPGENAIVDGLEQAGTPVSRAVWDGRASPAQFAADVAAMAAKGTAINYVALAAGTVVPPGQPDDGGSNHVNTWRIAYGIEGIRDWLFRQRRS